MRKNRKEDILRAAVDLFASRGFKGTTTRDLAAKAGVNEALIFRYFKTKRNLYRAIFDFKISGENREARLEELKKFAASNDDASFFEFIARDFLRKNKKDTSFLRLLLFSALEGHEFVEIFLESLSDQNPLARYIGSRIEGGTFRNVNPDMASHAFLGMLVSFILFQEIIGTKKNRKYSIDKVASTYVSIFLQGLELCPPIGNQLDPKKMASKESEDKCGAKATFLSPSG
jgi:AcrR family transcriptional regulator